MLLRVSQREREDGVIPFARSVEIVLRPPEHGWLDFVIALDDDRLEIGASWVLNDPLDELIELGTFVARGSSGARRVCLWLEPQGYALDVTNLNETIAGFHLRYDRNFVPPMLGEPMRTEIRRNVDRAALATAIRRGVEDLFLETRFEFGEEHWHQGARHARALGELRAAHRDLVEPGHKPATSRLAQLTFAQMLLANLEGVIPADRPEHRTKADALDGLRTLSGADFGDDVEAWKRWLREHEIF